MDAPELDEVLKSLPHFAGLPPELRARVARCARRITLRAGEAVFAQGEQTRGFYAVLAGAVRLHRLDAEGREQTVRLCRAGASFAEAAALSFPRYPVHAVATETPTALVEVGREGLLALLRDEPALAPAMLASLTTRLAQLVERVEELSLVGADQRLARWLLRQPARVEGGRAVVRLALPKRALAAHLAMTPETLSRLLRRLRETGALAVEREALTLLDEEALVALADGG